VKVKSHVKNSFLYNPLSLPLLKGKNLSWENMFIFSPFMRGATIKILCNIKTTVSAHNNVAINNEQENTVMLR